MDLLTFVKVRCNLSSQCRKKDCWHHSEHNKSAFCHLIYCKLMGKNCKCEAI